MNWEQKYDALASMIEGYRHERNEAQARVIDAALIHAELVRERDEAREEVERLRIALLEVQTSESAAAWFADGFHDGWKAGAEAMREACAREVVDGRLGVSSDDMAWLNDIASDLRDLPIPEES